MLKFIILAENTAYSSDFEAASNAESSSAEAPAVFGGSAFSNPPAASGLRRPVIQLGLGPKLAPQKSVFTVGHALISNESPPSTYDSFVDINLAMVIFSLNLMSFTSKILICFLISSLLHL